MQEMHVRFNLCGDVDQVEFCETHIGPSRTVGEGRTFADHQDLPLGGHCGRSIGTSFGDLLEIEPTHEGGMFLDRDGWTAGHLEASAVIASFVVGVRSDSRISAAAIGDLEEIVWVYWNEDRTVVARLDPDEAWAYPENVELANTFYIPAITRALSTNRVDFSERWFGPNWADTEL